MGIDRAEDDWELACSRGTDQAGGRAGLDGDGEYGAGAGRRALVETRDRIAYFDQLCSAAGDSLPASDRDKHPDSWDSAVLRFRERWAEHQERWPASARDTVDRSDDPPGSWRGDSGRYLDAADNTTVEAHCDRVAEAERTTISPAMRAIEAADPTRELVGWEHRLKGLDRMKDKVAATSEEQPRLAIDEALSDIPDSLRFTFCYSQDRYSKGVLADIERLKDHGFEQLPMRNTWDTDSYRGLNTRWREPNTGVRLEVQFHTYESYEAKQATHGVYEKLRNPQVTPAEIHELRGLQRDLVSRVPIPPDAPEIR